MSNGSNIPPGLYWFVDLDGQTVGPRAADLIQSAIRKKRIGPDTPISTNQRQFNKAIEVLGAAAFDENPSATPALQAVYRDAPPAPVLQAAYRDAPPAPVLQAAYRGAPPAPKPLTAHQDEPPAPPVTTKPPMNHWEMISGFALLMFLVLGGLWLLLRNVQKPPSSDHSVGGTVLGGLYRWKMGIDPYMLLMTGLEGLAVTLWLLRTRLRFLFISVNVLVLVITGLMNALFFLSLVFCFIIGMVIALFHGLAGIH